MLIILRILLQRCRLPTTLAITLFRSHSASWR